MSVKNAKKPSTINDLPKNFFQTTPLKLAVLSLCTFGLYEIYWFFEMLRRVDPESNKYRRAAKSLFGWVFLYELLTKLKVQRAALLAFVYFVACFTVRTPGAFWTLSLLSFIPLAYIQTQLNKRLPQPVKAPYSRTALAVIVIGGMIVLFSVIGFWTQNNSQPQDNKSVGYKNTSYQKSTDQDKSAQSKTTEQQSTDASVADASATPSATPTTKSATKTTTPSTTSASKSTATTPTTYPSADPAKLKQYAYVPTYPNDPQVTSISVNWISDPCTAGTGSYHYDANFLANAKAGRFTGQWELVSGPSNISMPYFLDIAIGQGAVARIYDNKYSAFSTYYGVEYSMRLHITAPNDTYSNVLTMPVCN